MCCMRRSTARLICLVSFVIVYVTVGSVIFSLIEGPLETQLRAETRNLLNDFVSQHSQCLPEAELEAFMTQIITANNRGIAVIGNVTSQPNWSFGQSFFFAGTILTTIGYGHVTPLSEGGKIFCIVYALIGIPLTLIMFTALVERIMVVTSKLLVWLTAKLGHKYRAFYIRLIHLSIVVTVLLLAIFIIPALAFFLIERGWNYLDAFYYCFISMTTIGLGDYIPGEQQNQYLRPVYKIATTFYLFIGLVLMMTVLATIYDVPELNIGFHFYLKSDEEEEERMRLRSSGDGPRYTQQVDEASKISRSVNEDEESNMTTASSVPSTSLKE